MLPQTELIHKSKVMKTHVLRRAGMAALIFLFSTQALPNTISISNGHLTGKNTTDHFVLVEFDISWENSWRDDLPGTGQAAPYNWDAAWVFVK